MSKTEFLEILKDYLKRDFSESEVNDILRDYEEYFIDGIIEGKSDMEIIAALGSPKSIAKDLISQMKEKDYKESSKRYSIDDKLESLKISIKEGYKTSKAYISEKLTPDLKDEGHTLSRKVIKVALMILSLFLIFPCIIFATGMIPIGIGLVFSLVAFFIAIPFVFSFIGSVHQVALLFIFASMIFIGAQILAWQIYIFIIKLAVNLIRGYISWLKTRNLYINASKRKEELEKEIICEENLNYEDDIQDMEGDERNE